MKPSGWLPLAAIVIALPALGKVPTLDEESYLWLGAHLDPLRPYSWTRAWPPYDVDGFVYAHPPLHLLWMWLLHDLPLVGQRLVSLVGWGGLLGWAVGRLAERGTHHPHLAGAAWLGCATVVLGLHDSLMIDLPAAALVTLGLAAVREAAEEDRVSWSVLAGVALGLAAWTKYPTVLAWPVVVAHCARRRGGWLAPGLALAMLVGLEGALWLGYHREHLWEVWTRRAEIASGPLAGRVLGTLARAALLPLPFLLVRTHPLAAAVGVVLAGVALVVGRPSALSAAELTALLLFASAGGLLLARGARGLRPRMARRRKGDRDDALLLGGTLVAWLVGVAFLHNYASARYLLPAAGPAAILLARSAEEVPGGKLLLRVSIGLGALLALAVAVADYRYARAGAQVARAAVEGRPVGTFAGEWSFRWAMESAGWAPLQPGASPPVGSLVVVVDNASPGAVDTTGWEPMRRVESPDHFPLRVNDPGRDVSLYAETLGVLPLGWSEGHLEGATVYEVRREAPR